MVVPTLESAEKTLQRVQDLLERVVRQNEEYPGAGATRRDLSQAGTLLQEMVNILSELSSQISAGFANDQDSAPAKETQQTFNKAASLISGIYDDIREAHAALDNGTTQSQFIQHAEIHLKMLVKHCHQAKKHLLAVRDQASGVPGGDVTMK